MTELGNGCGPEAGMKRRPEVVRRSLDRDQGEEIDGQVRHSRPRSRWVAADRQVSRPGAAEPARMVCPVIL